MQSSEEINKENDEELRLKNHIILSSDQLYSNVYTYGWYCPGGDSHTKNVHFFLNTND